nr:MAG TPA: hypothetical protein [Herelleviridae sp.]
MIPKYFSLTANFFETYRLSRNSQVVVFMR